MAPNRQRNERSENGSPVRRRSRGASSASPGDRLRRSFGGWVVLAALALSISCCAGSWRVLADHAKLSQPDAAAETPITCLVGFGRGEGSEGTSHDDERQRLRPDQINDGYCDCPGSGIDEPLTSACSGSENWSGSGPPPDRDERPGRHAFQCPQQPGKLLSPSKVGDGICDCCCGSDEPPGECEDVCDQVLAEERARKHKLQEEFRLGSSTRNQMLAEFDSKRTGVEVQVQEKRGELSRVEDQILDASRKVQQSKIAWYLARQQRVLDWSVWIAEGAHDGSGMGLFQPLTAPELVNWIVHACQLAGEMTPDSTPTASHRKSPNANQHRHRQTCLPLRLAGIDLGLVWKHSTYQVSRASAMTDVDSSGSSLVEQLAEMLHLNAHPDPGQHSIVYNEHGLRKRMQQLADADSSPSGSPTIGRARSHPRRRAPPAAGSGGEDDEDDYDVLEDDDFLEDPEHDEGDVDHHRSKPWRSVTASPPSSSDDDNGSGEESAESKRRRTLEGQRFAEELRERRPFGSSRKSFLEGSQILLDRMDAILEDMKKREEEEREAQRNRRRRELERRRKEGNRAEGDEVEGDDEDDAVDPIEDGETDSTGSEVNNGDEGDAEYVQAPPSIESLPESFDATALPLARDRLASLQSQIHKGYQYGVSAKILLDSLLEAYGRSPVAVSGDGSEDKTKPLVGDPELEVAARIHRDLSFLAAGTMAHGKISALLAWQIFLGVVSGLEADPASLESTRGDEGTCQSPWSSSCPPRSIQRTLRMESGGEVTIPPDAIRQVAEAFCDEQAALLVTTSTGSCASGPQLPPAKMALPVSIPDGFLGYSAPKPREQGASDPIAKALETWDLFQPKGDDADEADQKRSQLEENLEGKKQLVSKRKRLQDEIQDLLDSIGYEDPTKFGPDGELYALKDECYSYDTGKYVYEVCLFGSAKQKEARGGGSGTDLGRWTGTTVDEETGQRVWRWENGQRCWNGPSRSATAYITCGAKTRVVSVEEPEMCKYELQVESYIACDEAFRKVNSLDPE